MFTIAIVYIGVILALYALNNWLNKYQENKAYKALENRYKLHSIDRDSSPSRQTIAQLRGYHR